MKQNSVTILVEGAGTATAISVLKGLLCITSVPIRTIVTDMDDSAAGKHMADIFEKVPSSQDPHYVDVISKLCRLHDVKIYIPVIDYGFRALSEVADQLHRQGTYVMIAPPDSIDICTDKWKTYQFFLEHDIPTPPTWCTIDTLDFRHSSYILKPRIGGRASINVQHVKTLKQLESYTSESDNYLIQEYIDGQEFTADCLSDLSGTSLIEAVVRARLETKGGVSIKASIITGTQVQIIKKNLRTIVTALHIPGVCNIQGFIKKDGTVVFTEINPRFAGTHALTIAAGMNSIEAVIHLFLGKTAAEVAAMIQIDSTVRMVRYWNEIFIRGQDVWTWNHLTKE